MRMFTSSRDISESASKCWSTGSQSVRQPGCLSGEHRHSDSKGKLALGISNLSRPLVVDRSGPRHGHT